MLARNDVLDYVADHYGTCDRDKPARNDCYWGTDKLGRRNGCLFVGWRGRQCPHWHSVEGELADRLMLALSVTADEEQG